YRLSVPHDDGPELRSQSILENRAGYFFQSSGRVEQAGYGRSAFPMRLRVDANLGAGAERPTGSWSPEQNGKHRPAGKRDYRSLDGKRPRLYYLSLPPQPTRLYL